VSVPAIFPYLHFRGTCAEAMRYYAEVLGGTDLQMMSYGDAPAAEGQPPVQPSDLVLHAQMNAMGTSLMASDFPPGMAGDPQQAVSVMLAPATVAEARRLNEALKGGGVIAESGPTCFSKGFGMAKDRKGTHWIIGAAGD
jgi:PhnB protein